MLRKAFSKDFATFRKFFGPSYGWKLTRNNRGNKPPKLSKNMMAKTYGILLLSCLLSCNAVAQNINTTHRGSMAPKGFLENKGQLYNQHYQPNDEVLFLYHISGARLQLRQQGYSIELMTKKTEQSFSESDGERTNQSSYNFHRVDVQFASSNSKANIRKSKALPGSYNYYLHHTPEEGITKVKSYSQITYENIYPNIDIVFMLHAVEAEDNGLLPLGVKYNIVVKPGGKLEDVRLVYEGMEGITAASTSVELSTSLGNVQEYIPLSYTAGESGRQEIIVNYKTLDHGAGFSAPSFSSGDTLVIDPVIKLDRKWATFYGDDDADIIHSHDVGADGAVYTIGETNSTANISTSGAFQSSLAVKAGSSNQKKDVMLAKFSKDLDSLYWGTYYGGLRDDQGYAIALDGNDLYIAGDAKSQGVFSTSSVHDTSHNGGFDLFLAKFNTSGSRSWSTYFGGSADDHHGRGDDDQELYDRCLYVGSNYIYLVGNTKSSGIASSAKWQSSYGGNGDGIITKFTKSGSLSWANYYGGKELDEIYAVHANSSGDLFITGTTESGQNIASKGSATHKKFLPSSDDFDAFVAKFDNTGDRKWGTYYGGEKDDFGTCIHLLGNDIIIGGYTESKDSMTTSGTIRASKSSTNDEDGIVARFSSSGALSWGTYFGDNGKDERIYSLDIDAGNNIAVAGWTKSSKLYRSVARHQIDDYGNEEAFFSKINANARKVIWFTYYGDGEQDIARSIVMDSDQYIVGAGYSASTNTQNRLATTGAHQTSNGGGRDGFIVRFCDIIVTQQPQDQKVWIGNSASFNVKHIGTKDGAWKYQWYKNDTAIAGATGLTLNISNADSSDAGLYKLKISNDCGTLLTDSARLTVCSYTPPKRICKGESTTVTFAREKGASYKWTPNIRLSVDTGVQVTLSPFKTTDYTVTITNGTKQSTVKFTVTVKDIPPADAGVDITLCSGQTGQLGSSGCTGCTYSWTPSAGLSSTSIANPTVSHTLSGTTSQTFTYKVTVSKAGCDSTDEVKVTVHPLPKVDAGKNKTVCINSGKLSLSGSPSGGTWSGRGIPASSNSNFAPGLAGAGSHTLTYVYTNSTTNCSDSDQIVVTVDSLPHVYAGADTFFCNTATSATLKGFSPSGGTWSGHTNLTSAGVFNPKTAGNGKYTVYYTYKDPKTKCDSTHSIVIEVGNITSANAGKDVSVCVNEAAFQLVATSPSGGSWSGKGVSAGTFNPSNAGVGKHKITYTVGSGTCLSTDDIIVTVNSLPSISLSSVGQKCLNDADFKLKPSSGGTWTGKGVSGYDFSPSTAGAGKHYVVYTEKNSFGCEASDSIQITVNDTPAVQAFDTTVCYIAGEVQLRAKPSSGDWSGSTYLKTNGKFNADKAGVGKYTVYYTYEESSTKCQSLVSAVVEVIAPTSVNAGGDDTFCIDTPFITLSGAPSGGIWTGNGVSGNTFTPSKAQKGRNELIYSIGSGTCLNRDTLYIQVNDLPSVNAGKDLSKCLNDAVFNLNISSGGTWSGTGVSSNTFDPAIASKGDHFPRYTITDANGCSNYDSIKITVNDTPSVQAFDTTVCYIAGEVQLRAKPSGGDWSGSTYLKTNGKYDAAKAGVGKETVYYTYKNSSTKCQSVVSAVIEVIAPQAINAGADDTLCIDATPITLKGTPGGGVWSGPGITDSTFSPANAQKGQNEIIYSKGSGTCLNRDTLYIQVNDLPVVRAGSDISLCKGDDTLTINTGYPTKGTWSGKGIQNAKRGLFDPIVADTGVHSLVYAYTDANGCRNTDTLNATVHSLPGITVRDTTVCNIAGKIQLFSQPSTGSWSGHKELAPNGLFDVSKADTSTHKVYYTLTEASTKCQNIDSITVTVINPKRARAGADTAYCINHKPINLVGKPKSGLWSGKGVSASQFDPAKAGSGSHWLYYTFGSGSCEHTDSLQMTVNALPKVDAGGTTSSCISNDSLLLTKQSPPGGYWTGKVFIDTANGVFSPAQSGVNTHAVYYHMVDSNQCYNVDTGQVIVHPLPKLKVSSLLQLCNQPVPVTLSGQPGGGFWKDKGSRISMDSIYTPNGVDTHQVFYVFTDGNGCKNRDSTRIEVIDPEQVKTMKDTQVCHLSDSIQLRAQPTGGSWTPGPNNNSGGMFYPRTTGTHTLLYAKGSGTCRTFDTLKVEVIPLPTITRLPAQSVCEDADTFRLDTNSYAPLGGIWQGPTVADTLLGSIWPALTGGDSTSTLIYRYTDPSTQCSSSDTSRIRVHALPVVNTTDTTICNQAIASRFLGSPSGGTWSQNGILSNGTFTPVDTGQFEVVYTYSDSNSCVNHSTMTITVTEPVHAIAGLDFEMCIYDVKQLYGNDTASGWWTGDDITAKGLFTPQTDKVYQLIFSLGSGTCLTKDSITVDVHPLPNPKFSGAPDKLCTNDLPYDFLADVSPKGGWFENAHISDTLKGTFDPSTAGLGSHTLYYHYIDAKGCYQLDSHTVIVNGLPKLNFNLDSVLCVNTAITFPNNSPSTNTYRWNFGDGSGWKTTFSPTHTYTKTGYFHMRVIGTTPEGCSDSFGRGFYVIAPPQARFDISPKKGCGPLHVSFKDRSVGRFTSYRWGFETGDTLYKKDLQVFPFPSYVYDSIIYTLELRVTNVCKSVYWYDSVTVYPTPTANVKIEPRIGCTPFAVTFRNRSYGMPGNFLYHFGDGNTSSRLDTLFQYAYFTDTTRSVYTFRFSTENICGADTQLTDIIVKPNRLRAFFELDTNQGCTPFVMRAEDHHVGNATVSWRVSDGTSYGYQDTVLHTLTEPGTYTLIQMLDNGCARDTFTSTVVVHQSPEASFSIDSTHTCQNVDVHFENTTPAVSAHRWDFGDGKTSELAAPSRRFPSADTFQVRLTVVGDNEFQCEASVSKPVVILPLPQIMVSPSDTAGCRAFSSPHLSRSGNALYFEWLMNDGSGARYSGDSIWHTYQDSGVFRNQLIAESAQGCVDTGTFVTRVLPSPEAAFSTDSSIYCGAPKDISFFNETRFGSVFRWEYGDGKGSNAMQGKHRFDAYGTYTVRLFAENRYQCQDSFSLPIELLRKPIIDISPSEDGCEPLPLTFTNNTRFGDSFYWELSDGRNSTEPSPNFLIYEADQPFSIKLIASSKATCFDSLELENPVAIWPKPVASFTYQEILLPQPHGNFIFSSTSPPMAAYRWDYGDGNKGKGAIDTHRFAYRNSFWVQHFVTNDFGCLDTSAQWLTVDMYGLFVPNTMLLDGSVKDYTLFKPQGVGLQDYRVEVFTTWGELVWQSTALNNNRPSEWWDGRDSRSGRLLDEDAYVWRIEATFLNGEKWQGIPDEKGRLKTFGTITIVR